MNNEVKTVYTGLYGKTAAKSLKLLLARFRSYGSVYSSSGDTLTGHYTSVRIDDVGNVCLDIRSVLFSGTYYKYYEHAIANSPYANGLDTAYIKKWFANKLLAVIAGLAANNQVVRIHCSSNTSPPSRVWEIRATADALIGADVKSIYGETIYDKVVGKAVDPVKAEVNSVIIEETAKIHDEFKAKQAEIKRNLDVQVLALRKQYRKDIADLGKAERRAVSAMKKEMLAGLTTWHFP